jgi:AraC-like DNA-binding protein
MATLWATTLRVCMHGFEELGLDTARILRDAGIDERVLANPDGRIPFEQAGRIWPAAEKQWGRPGLGLHTGAALPFGVHGAIDYVLLAADDLRTGLRDVCAAFSVVSEGATHLDYSEAPDGGARLVFSGMFPPQVRDYVLAAFAGRMGLFGVAPTRVTLAGPLFDEVARYRDVFGCDVEPEATTNALHLPADACEAKLERAQYPGLARIVGREVERLLELVGDVSPDTQARRVIAELLPHGTPTVEEVAGHLNMSARTLQRRLKASGHTLRGLIDETRAALARGHLGSSHLTIAEIAYLLGYADPSTFAHAFRRWEGVSPREYRDRRRR